MKLLILLPQMQGQEWDGGDSGWGGVKGRQEGGELFFFFLRNSRVFGTR